MKSKLLSSIFGLAGLLALHPLLHAQAVPTATRGGGHLQAGGGVMYLNNDLNLRTNYGLTAWVDYDFNRFIGVEAEAHFGGLISPDDKGENSYMIGPRFSYRRRAFNVYGKFVFGRGVITDQFPGHNNASSTYNIYALGGGLDYRLNRRFTIRAVDIEMQKWGNFEPHTLSPIDVNIGLMYNFR